MYQVLLFGSCEVGVCGGGRGTFDPGGSVFFKQVLSLCPSANHLFLEARFLILQFPTLLLQGPER